MAEWTNPIFYLNLAGFVASIVVLARWRDADWPGAWRAATWVLAVATGLHVIGDLAGVSENADHIFIHAAVAAALLIPAVRADR